MYRPLSRLRDYLTSLVDLMRYEKPDSLDGIPVFAETDGPLPPAIAKQIEAYRRTTPKNSPAKPKSTLHPNQKGTDRDDGLAAAITGYKGPSDASSHSSGRR